MLFVPLFDGILNLNIQIIFLINLDAHYISSNQGCLQKFDTLDALQCTDNVVFIAMDTQ